MLAPIFDGRLLAGERVIWSGRPAVGILFSPRDTFLVPFSLMWCGFAIFWTFAATGSHAPDFFTLWGLMFVCVGLYFVFGRFAMDAWVRGRTDYAVTDRRILIARPAPFATFAVLSLAQLPNIELVERRAGRGTIRFGPSASLMGHRNMGIWSPALDPTPQFIAIDDARNVFDLIQRASGSVG